jgi:hypothetical protein
MISNFFSPPARRLLVALLSALLFVVHPALAAGNFSLKTPAVDEKGGEWHVKVRIDLPHAPPMIHTPMRFTFSKEAVDERAIMKKGAEPEHHRMVLDVATKQIVSLDVDFADPAGKVFKSTYFEFDLSRKDGYFEAGEYLMALSGPDGEIGTSQKIVLKGDNPPVYRGAMDFSADAKPTKKKGPRGPNLESVSSGIDGGAASGGGDGDTPSAAPTSTEVAAAGPAPDMVPKGAYDRTADEQINDHPKGCGCVAAGSGAPLPVGASALAAIAAIAIAMRVGRRRLQ